MDGGTSSRVDDVRQEVLASVVAEFPWFEWGQGYLRRSTESETVHLRLDPESDEIVCWRGGAFMSAVIECMRTRLPPGYELVSMDAAKLSILLRRSGGEEVYRLYFVGGRPN